MREREREWEWEWGTQCHIFHLCCMQQFVCGMYVRTYVDLWHVLRMELPICVLLLLGLRGEDVLRVFIVVHIIPCSLAGAGPGVL